MVDGTGVLRSSGVGEGVGTAFGVGTGVGIRRGVGTGVGIGVLTVVVLCLSACFVFGKAKSHCEKKKQTYNSCGKGHDFDTIPKWKSDLLINPPEECLWFELKTPFAGGFSKIKK